MKRILTAVLLCCGMSTPALAAPWYTGIQLDDSSVGVLLGYQLDKTYALEMQYTKTFYGISGAGITMDANYSGLSIIGIARFRKKLRKVLPYYLFVKAGIRSLYGTEDYFIPASVTLTLPYSGQLDTGENQLIFGGGAEYHFNKNLAGRVGLDILGRGRSINLAAIYKF